MAIRIGLVGAGRTGRAHLQSLCSFPEVKIAAIADSDRARAEAAAQPFGANVHINFRTMLESERLDAVFVCLPPFARGEPEIAAARAGIHLFLEPPVALNVEKARQIQKEIEKAGVVNSVAYIWRYLSGTAQAIGLLKERRIAAARIVNFAPPATQGWRHRRDSAGGQLVLAATDLIDLARYLCGEMAVVSAALSQGILASRLPDYDMEDAVAATIRFQSGAVCDLLSCCASPVAERSLTIVADRLQLRLTAQAMEIVEQGKRTEIEHAGLALQNTHTAFLEAVESGSSSSVRATYADAVRSLDIALAANEAAQSGKIVNL